MVQSLAKQLRRTPPLVLAMAVLSAGLIAASSVLVKGFRTAGSTITVTGASSERIRSDFVDWSVELKQNAPSQQIAYQQLQPAVEQTLAFLKARGVAPEALQLEAVKSFLTLQPKLIDSRGPHGFSLHFHAQLAGKDAEKMVAYLQTVKKVELKPNPFVKVPPPM